MIQLKPREESFQAIVSNLTKKFDAIILCGGKSDAEIIKILNRKVGLQLGNNIAITHSEGIRNMLKLAKYISVLSRLSRKLKLLGIIIDLDDKKPEERFNSIKNSLNAANLQLESIQKLKQQVYNGILKINNRSLDIKIALAGLTELPFQRHMIEDYITKIALTKNQITQEIPKQFNSAKTLLQVLQINIRSILNNTGKQELEEVFEPIVTMLEKIKQTTQQTQINNQ